MISPRTYSPTQTETYVFCPMLRTLKYAERWEPRKIGKKQLGGILGTGFAKGMAVYNTARKNQATVIKDDCISAAVCSINESLEKIKTEGYFIGEYDQSQANSLYARVTRAVTKSIEQDPIPSDWKILDVEFTIPNSGDSRLDLAIDDSNGPMIIDYKSKLTLDSRYRDKEIAQYKRSWQLFHYAYHYGLHLSREIDRYGIVLAVLEPRFSIELLQFTIGPEAKQQWLAFAQTTWQEMEEIDRGDRIPRGQLKCSNEYGPCEMVRACWDFHYDENLMLNDYVRRA